MHDNSIAIIIPAYKPDYLARTLTSLASQTDTAFSLYIGDDASPFGLKSIIEPFKKTLDITYIRFDTNVGGKDLVAQWNRCLEMMEGERFFIMFSDDDEMEPNCISKLKETIAEHNEDVFRFNLQVINVDGRFISNPVYFPPVISSLDFFDKVCSSNSAARMPEFIFRTSHFISVGGFVPFKDAIRSDNAVVIACGFAKGIRTIDGPRVLWRDSGINISSSLGPKTKERYETFLSTSVSFFNWMEAICLKNNTKMPWSVTRRFDYLFSCAYNFRPFMGTTSMWRILKTFKHYPKGISGIALWFNLFLLKLKRKLTL